MAKIKKSVSSNKVKKCAKPVKKKKWEVCLPISGTLSMVVTAETEKEAIDKALHMDYDPAKMDLSWSQQEHLVRGNVWMGDFPADAEASLT